MAGRDIIIMRQKELKRLHVIHKVMGGRKHWGQEALGSGLVSCILIHCYVIKQHGKASQDRI